MSRIGKFIETESRVVVTVGCSGGMGVTADGRGASFEDDENVPEVNNAQLCEYIQNH